MDDAADDPPVERPEAFVAALRACLAEDGRDPATIRVARLDGDGRAAFGAANVQELQDRLEGDVLLPGDHGWDAATTLWNAMASTSPALVAQPASAHDVAAVVDLARREGLLLSVRGGGHNIGARRWPRAPSRSTCRGSRR